MAEKSIIIIGAGIAGLAAGCYGQMNGYDTQIFELHDRPGGLCTAWERKGYTFDGCIHYLFGSGRGQPYNQVWQELGAVQGRPMIDHEKFMEIVDPAGQRLIVYSDPERLAAHMKALSPEDAELIDALAGGIRQFTRFDMSVLQQKPRALMGVEDWREFGAQMMPYLGALMKWGRMSAQEFADRFHSPFLRRAIPQMFAWPDIPMMAGLSLLAYMHTGNAGFPAGGSLAFAQAIEQRYLALGGQIHYKAHVEKILVVDDRAVGVRLYTDEERRADYVISAADGRNTVFEMLDGQYADRRIRQQYDGRLPIHSQIQVSLGVNADLSAAPHWATYLLDEPLVLAGEPYAQLSVKHYGFDASLAPAGKS
ncbi:MAG: NAD(P)/FAD-dependent oxidoreductase, partial [Anaerolineales bacterium]|nr:NAD(P)/FAD-dependent oxidoreductase [Anaerolineales bacterium]